MTRFKTENDIELRFRINVNLVSLVSLHRLDF